MLAIDGKQPPSCGPRGPGHFYMYEYSRWIAENLHPNAEVMYIDFEGISEMPTYDSLKATAEHFLGKQVFDEIQQRCARLRGDNPKLRAIIGALYGTFVPPCASNIVESIFSGPEQRGEGILHNRFAGGGKTTRMREMVKNREFGTRYGMSNTLYHRKMLDEFARHTRRSAQIDLVSPDDPRIGDRRFNVTTLRQGDDVLKTVWPKMDFDISTLRIRPKRDDWMNRLQQIPKTDKSVYDQMKRFDKLFESLRGPFGSGGKRMLVLDSMGSFYTDECLNREPPNAAVIFDEADKFRFDGKANALTEELMKGVDGGIFSTPPKFDLSDGIPPITIRPKPDKE